MAGSPGNPTVGELLAELSPRQRAKLDRLKTIRDQLDIFRRQYAAQIIECQNDGISYAMMATELGVSKETIWKSASRLKERLTK